MAPKSLGNQISIPQRSSGTKQRSFHPSPRSRKGRSSALVADAILDGTCDATRSAERAADWLGTAGRLGRAKPKGTTLPDFLAHTTGELQEKEDGVGAQTTTPSRPRNARPSLSKRGGGGRKKKRTGRMEAFEGSFRKRRERRTTPPDEPRAVAPALWPLSPSCPF